MQALLIFSTAPRPGPYQRQWSGHLCISQVRVYHASPIVCTDSMPHKTPCMHSCRSPQSQGGLLERRCAMHANKRYNSNAICNAVCRANTGGCTTQACGFRDNYDKLLEAGYKVYGLVSGVPAEWWDCMAASSIEVSAAPHALLQVTQRAESHSRA